MDERQRLKRSLEVSFKRIEDELVMLHLNTGNYYTLNATGCEIWNFCDQPRSVGEIMDFIASTYSTEWKTIRRDVTSYLEELLDEKILEPVET